MLASVANGTPQLRLRILRWEIIPENLSRPAHGDSSPQENKRRGDRIVATEVEF